MNNILEKFKQKLYKQEKPIAPMLYIYGNAGMGKSSLAADFPDPFFIMTEQAFPNDNKIDGRSIYVKTYNDLIDSLRTIYAVLKDGSFSIKTLVLDNLSGIEHLISSDIYRTTNKKISDYAYGSGYDLLKDYWTNDEKGLYKAIKAINEDFGVAIILIDHCNIELVSLPNQNAFNKYVPSIYRKVRDYLAKSVDEIMFIDVIYQERTEEGAFGKKELKVCTSEQGFLIRSGNGQAEYLSKSRYGLPSKILYKKDAGFTSLATLLPNWYDLKCEGKEKLKGIEQ